MTKKIMQDMKQSAASYTSDSAKMKMYFERGEFIAVAVPNTRNYILPTGSSLENETAAREMLASASDWQRHAFSD